MDYADMMQRVSQVIEEIEAERLSIADKRFPGLVEKNPDYDPYESARYEKLLRIENSLIAALDGLRAPVRTGVENYDSE